MVRRKARRPVNLKKIREKAEATTEDELASALSGLQVSAVNQLATPGSPDPQATKHGTPAFKENEATRKRNALPGAVEKAVETDEPKAKEGVVLRDYQVRMYEQIIAAKESSLLAYLPTGGGKTLLAVHLIKHTLLSEDARCLFVVNRNTLIDQTAKSLTVSGLADQFGFIKAKYPSSEARVQIASIQTFTQRQKRAQALREKTANTREPAPVENLWGDFQLIVIDEAHGAVASQYLKLLSLFPKARIVGLTATPFRLNKKESLGQVFKASIKGPSISQLIKRKFLVRPIVFAPSTAPHSILSTKAAKHHDTIKSAVEQWKKRCKDLRTIAFCATLKQSRALLEEFRESGVDCECMDGSTGEEERAEMFASLVEGRTKVLCSVGTLNEGFDMPEVQALLLLRPTKSKGLYIQQIGRGLRILDNSSICKKSCIVLDEVGNSYRHGLVDGGHLWSHSFQSEAKTRNQVAAICNVRECFVLLETDQERCLMHSTNQKQPH